EARPAERRGDEVDPLGRPPNEDDFLVFARVHESAHLAPPRLERERRALRELVHAAVHVRAVVLVKVAHRIDDGVGLQRGRRAVEVDEGLAMGGLSESREILPDSLDIECRYGCWKRSQGRHASSLAVAPPGRRLATVFSSSARSVSSGTASTISRAK